MINWKGRKGTLERCSGGECRKQLSVILELREQGGKLGKKNNPKTWRRDQNSALGRDQAELGHRLSCLRLKRLVVITVRKTCPGTTAEVMASLVAQLVKNLPAIQETPVRFLEDPLGKG